MCEVSEAPEDLELLWSQTMKPLEPLKHQTIL